MRKLAFISDIHSNLEALNAVLARLDSEEVYCLGDVVGYGADPNGVVERLWGVRAKALMGNHDHAVVTGDTEGFNARAAMAVKWTSSRLTSNNLEHLRALPLEMRETFDGAKAYMTHGSPDDRLWEYVDTRTHQDLFPYYFWKTGVSVIGLGHTHVPFSWKGSGGSVFNPGSVGQPRDGDPRASYAIVRVDGNSVGVDLQRVDYDRQAAAQKIVNAGLPQQLADRLFVGL